MSVDDLLNKDVSDLDFADGMEFFRKYQRYIFLFLIMVISLVLYLSLIKPKSERYFAKVKILKEYNKLLKAKTRKVMDKGAIETEIDRLKYLVSEREGIFFSENDFNEFSINILPKISQSYNNKIQSVIYKKPKTKDNVIMYQVDLVLSGNFQGIINFINDIESFSKVVKVDDFNIVRRKLNPIELSADISLSLYGKKQ